MCATIAIFDFVLTAFTMVSRLLDLPTELHLSILNYLPYLDLHTLRLTNSYFYALIPPPTNAKLFSAAISEFEFLTSHDASYTKRESRITSWTHDMRRKPCTQCGSRRPYNGMCLYLLLRILERHELLLTRSSKCRRINEPDDQPKPLSSWFLSRRRKTQTAKLLMRVSRKMTDREEREIMGALWQAQKEQSPSLV